MTNKKLNYPAIAKEMAILTGAVAIIAAAVYFFWCPVIHPSAVFPALVSCFLILCRCRFRLLLWC